MKKHINPIQIPRDINKLDTIPIFTQGILFFVGSPESTSSQPLSVVHLLQQLGAALARKPNPGYFGLKSHILLDTHRQGYRVTTLHMGNPIGLFRCS